MPLPNDIAALIGFACEAVLWGTVCFFTSSMSRCSSHAVFSQGHIRSSSALLWFCFYAEEKEGC